MRVELIYDSDCPNVEVAREHLLRAFAEARIRPQWSEWNRGQTESPQHVHGHGSPTILVNGRDVAAVPPDGSERSCRLYEDASGKLQGAPPVGLIAASLRKAKGD